MHLKFNQSSIQKASTKKLKVYTALNNNIAILKLFPGINHQTVNAILNIKGIKAIVLETFGSGNASTEHWFLKSIEQAVKKGIVIYDVTQCRAGSVELGKYETSAGLKKAGVISGKDITTEAAVAKLMFLLGRKESTNTIKKSLETSLRGEMG